MAYVDEYQALNGSAEDPLVIVGEPTTATTVVATTIVTDDGPTATHASPALGTATRGRRPANARTMGSRTVPMSSIVEECDSESLYGTITARSWQEEARAAQTPVHSNRGSRWCVAFAAALLVVVGLAVVLLGDVQRNDSVLPVCPNCHALTKGLMIAGAVVVGVGLFGLLAAYSRRRCAAFTFSALTGLVALVFLLVAILLTLVHTGAEGADLERMWKSAVNNDAALVCSLQRKFNCSGFTVSCRAHDGPNEAQTMATTTTVSPSSRSTQCSPQCSATNNNTNSCEAPIRTNLDDNIVPVLGAAYGAGVFFVTAAIASVRMTFRSRHRMR